MKKIIILCITAILATNSLFAQKTSPFRLHGDVSCIKMYHQYWDTKFGERNEYGKEIVATFYYSKDHRLLHANTNKEGIYQDGNKIVKERESLAHHYKYYEYEYNDAGNLVTIDCYAGWGAGGDFSDKAHSLEYKIKLKQENGITVSHIYRAEGYELEVYSPYNEISPGLVLVNPYIDMSIYTPNNYKYLFAFEIFSEPVDKYRYDLVDYYYEYNTKKQLTRITDSVGPVVTLSYDEAGNITKMDRRNDIFSDKGDIYIFEYVYNDFEESEKYRLANVKKRVEQETAKKDSIARAERLAKELKIKKEKEEKEAADRKLHLDKLKFILKNVSPLYTSNVYMGFRGWDNLLNKREIITDISRSSQDTLLVTFYNMHKRYHVTDCIKYVYDGITYNAYYDDSLNHLIISSDKKTYLIDVDWDSIAMKRSSSEIFGVQKVPRSFQTVIKDFLNEFTISDKIDITE